jgi:predicted O-methyltransferase YrrM
MRSIKHWTPRYVCDRIREMVDHRQNPGHPWLTRESTKLLPGLLRETDVALEFGSGRSTRWFARRVKKITSVDHDEKWYQDGLRRMQAEDIRNIELLLRPADVPEEQGPSSAYVRVLEQFEDGSVDFCLVDGIYRGSCALNVLPKLRDGALLVIDNVNWYIPCSSRSPGALPLGGPYWDHYWETFDKLTRNWRKVWTTSGVTDTLLLFKA